MFNRPRNQSGQQSAIASAFDDVLAELGSKAAEAPAESTDPTAAGDSTDGADGADSAATPSVTDRITEHAETLRATRDAQHRAEEMLALAATARSEATDQAEQIVLEAKTAAEQVRTAADEDAETTRREAVEWVKEQRARVESATAQLTRNAERDAENIRTEAMRSAMIEAEQTARLYVGEAAARGARDAEEIRGTAREVLHRAAELGSDLQTSLGELVRVLQLATGAVSDQLRAIDELLDEVRRDSSATPAPESTDATDDEASDAEAGAVDGSAAVQAQDAEPTVSAERSDAGDGSRKLGALFRDPAS
jgi:glutamyl/glutaminyl-tRNA synthetase